MSGVGETAQEIRIRVAGIICKQNKMLLIGHKKAGKEYWLLPGGGVNFGESLADALKREFIEELNLKIEVGDVAFILDSIAPNSERHIVNICFNCAALADDIKLGNEDRLSGFGFFDAKTMASIQIYPPINTILIDVLNGGRDKAKIYCGTMWSE